MTAARGVAALRRRARRKLRPAIARRTALAPHRRLEANAGHQQELEAIDWRNHVPGAESELEVAVLAGM